MSDKFLKLVEMVLGENTIFAAKTSAYLMPVVAVFGNKTSLCFKEIGEDLGSCCQLELGVHCVFSIGVDFVFLVFRSEGK